MGQAPRRAGEATIAPREIRTPWSAPHRRSRLVRITPPRLVGNFQDSDDLELLESRTFDNRSQLLVYRPTIH